MAVPTADIFQALTDAVVAFATGVGLPVEYPLRVFTPPTINPPAGIGRYLQMIFLPNSNQNFGWASDAPTEHSGILRLGVVDPLKVGPIVSYGLCDQIVVAFAKGSTFTKNSTVVQISEKPSLLTGIPDGQRVIYPVSIRYRTSG